MLSYFGGFWDTWLANHKVTFDPENKLVHINYGVTYLNVKIDIYSDWKEWAKFTETDNSKYLPPIIGIGGQPISPTEKLGDTYFLQNGWRIKPWTGHSSITIEGNLYTDDVQRPIVPDDNGVDAVSLKVSSLTNTVIVGTDDSPDYVAPTWVGAVGITDIYQNGVTIAVRWGMAVDDRDAQVSYNVYMSKFENTVYEPFNLVQTVDGNLTNIRFEDVGGTPLQSGDEYFVGVRAIDSSGNETDNTNIASQIYIASVQGASDVNIIAVNGSAVNSIDDFKADLSNIPAEVWAYTTRELTDRLSLTPAQQDIVDQILADIELKSQSIKNTVVAMS